MKTIFSFQLCVSVLCIFLFVGCSLIVPDDEKPLDTSKFPTISYDPNQLKQSYASQDSIKIDIIITDQGLGPLREIEVVASIDSLDRGGVILERKEIAPPQSSVTYRLATTGGELERLISITGKGKNVWINFTTHHGTDPGFAYAMSSVPIKLK